jgi:hypothetical protein
LDTILVRKTKAPLQTGDIVRRWGTRWKRAGKVKNKGQYGIVVNVNDDSVEIVGKYCKVIDYDSSKQ